MERVSMAASAGRITGQLVAARDFSSGFEPGRDYRNLSLASTDSLTTGLGVTSVDLGYSDRPFGADQFYGNFNSWENTKTWFASVEQTFGERTVAAFSFRRHSDLYVLERYHPEVYTNHHADETYDASVRRREPLSANTSLHYGAEAYRDSIASTNLGAHDRGRAAGYVSFDARAMRRFSFSAGAREELWKWGRAQFSPTASAGAWLSSKWKLRASASRAFRVPSYTDLYYSDPANIGNPALKPENAWTYEAGADWAPKNSVRLSAAVFERRETNGIDYVRATTAGPWSAVNLASLTFKGAEASATIAPARGQQFAISYEALTGAQHALNGLQSKYVFNYPSQSGIASWQGAFGRGLVARTRLAVVNRLARSPYALLDAYAAWNHGRLHPFVQLTNLAKARYEEIAGVVMPGRGILGGLELVIRGK
jgi:iron complex outermembrane receptor protein